MEIKELRVFCTPSTLCILVILFPELLKSSRFLLAERGPRGVLPARPLGGSADRGA